MITIRRPILSLKKRRVKKVLISSTTEYQQGVDAVMDMRVGNVFNGAWFYCHINGYPLHSTEAYRLTEGYNKALAQRVPMFNNTDSIIAEIM